MVEAAVEFRRVTVRHPRSFGPVFQQLSVRVEAGLTTVVGSHMSGKSSLLAAAAGVIRPRRGNILLLGRSLRRHRRALMARTGYQPHTFVYLPRVTIAEAIAYSAWLKNVSPRYLEGAVQRAIDATGLGNWRSTVLDQAPEWVRRRAGLAQALVHAPELLILDEPTAGLSAAQRAEYNALIPGLAVERSVVVSSRVPEEAHASGRVLLLHGGQVRFHGPAEVFTPEIYAPWVHPGGPDPALAGVTAGVGDAGDEGAGDEGAAAADKHMDSALDAGDAGPGAELTPDRAEGER